MPTSAPRPREAADENGDAVMLTTAAGRRGRAHYGEGIAKPVRLGALLAALILVSVTINGLVIAVDGSLRQAASAVELAR
jgi:hypothetical protein